jgi:aspartyl-tRNA(Asn)/glutamyl-tRNA(Gln) amidotransferase subunit C
MAITPEQVKHVAKLARLAIDPVETKKFARQLDAILGYIDKLNEVDTKEVTPTSHAIALTNAFRDDAVHIHLNREKALDNAPAQDGGCFVVPKVI